MRHLFVIYSNLTYLLAKAVIQYHRLDEEACRFLSMRDYVPPDEEIAERTVAFPFPSNDLSFYYSLFYRQVRRNIASLDEFISRLTDGEDFHLYIPYTHGYCFRILATHPHCTRYSLLQEGYFRGREDVLLQKSASLPPYSASLMRRCNNNRLLTFDGAFLNTNEKNFDKLYLFDELSFTDHPRRQVLENVFSPCDPSLVPDCEAFLILDGFPKNFSFNLTAYKRSLKRLLDHIVTETAITRIAYCRKGLCCLEPNRDELARLFAEYPQLHFEEIPRGIVMESLMLSAKKPVFFVQSSLGFIAAMPGCEVYSSLKTFYANIPISKHIYPKEFFEMEHHGVRFLAESDHEKPSMLLEIYEWGTAFLKRNMPLSMQSLLKQGVAWFRTKQNVSLERQSTKTPVPPEQTPLVSVVVPIFNVEKYLAECLDSILTQTYRHIEVIGIDDGSTDLSADILDRYAATDSRITIIKQENRGLAAARNIGLSRAKGDYVLFVDSDDTIAADLCEKCVDKSLRENADVVLFFFDRPDAPGWEIDFSRFPVETMRSPEQKQIALPYCYAWNKLCRTSLFRQNRITFPDGLCFEDVPVHWETIRRANAVAVVPETLLHYRFRNDSISQRFDKHYLDIVPVFEMTEKKFDEDNAAAAYRNALSQFKLQRMFWHYQRIHPKYKDTMKSAIQKTISATDRHLYRNTPSLAWYIRDFYLSLENQFASKFRYKIVSPLLWLAVRYAKPLYGCWRSARRQSI